MFTVFSYNIHKGFNATNRRFLLHEIRHAIRAVDADVVFLQEVVGHGHRYGVHGHDNEAGQFEYLADQVWPHHAYGRNALYDNGHHGNAILTKYPFQDWRNIDLTKWRFSQRGLLIGRIEHNIYLCCVHLGLLQRERKFQVEMMLQSLEKWVPEGKPLIIAGDFNDWKLQTDKQLKSYGLKEACTEHFGRPAKTFPAKLPVLAVDRIYFRNLELVDAAVMKEPAWRRLSDHCGITATFKKPPTYTK